MTDLDIDDAEEWSRMSQAAADMADELEQIRERRKASSGPLHSFKASDLAGTAVKPRAWQVDNLIPSRNVTLLMANGGDGKSLLALQLAVATNLGILWLGRDCQLGTVLYVSAEDDREELHRRLSDIVAAERCSLDDLDSIEIVDLVGKDAVLAAPDPPTGLLKETQLFVDLRAKIARTRPAILMLDTLADIFGGDENKKTQARQFITMLRGLAVEHDMAVLLIAHPSQSGMSTGTGTAGSTAWSNSVRSRLYLERVRTAQGLEVDPDVRVLSVKKSNYAPTGSTITLRWKKGVFIVEQGATLTAGPGLAAHAEQVFLDLLGQYERETRPVSATPSANYAPKLFGEHPNSRGLTKHAFTTAMNCQIASKRDPLSRAIPTPRKGDTGLSTWVHRRDPRPERSALALRGAEGVGGSCAPRWIRSGMWRQLRFLKRQLVLPVSMMSQWWVRRSSMAVVILASPNT